MSDVTDVYDAEADSYDDYYKIHGLHAAEDFVVSIILRSAINRDTKVLDIGCGTGSVVDYGNIQPENYLGVDVSSGMVKVAEGKYPNHKFVVSDARALNVGGKFDFITFIYGQVNYMGVKAMADILLKHGTKDVKFMAICYAREFHDDYGYSSKHQTVYSPKDMREVLSKNGVNSVVRGFSWETPYAPENVFSQLSLVLSTKLSDDMSKNPKYFIVSNLDMLGCIN